MMSTKKETRRKLIAELDNLKLANFYEQENNDALYKLFGGFEGTNSKSEKILQSTVGVLFETLGVPEDELWSWVCETGVFEYYLDGFVYDFTEPEDFHDLHIEGKRIEDFKPTHTYTQNGTHIKRKKCC